MLHRSACVPQSLCVIVVDSMLIIRGFFREENNKTLMRFKHTNVRLTLRYTQNRVFTGVIIPHTAMIHLFLQFHVILQLIIKIFFCFIYYKTITNVFKNVIIYFTHFSTDPAKQTGSVKMKEFYNRNCELNVATLIDFKTNN